MKRLLCLAILLAPWAVQANGGSWSADGNGRILSQKGMVSNQPPLAPPPGEVPPAAAIDDVVWQITLLSPAPDGLNLQLCSARRCMALDGLSGRSAGLNGESRCCAAATDAVDSGEGDNLPADQRCQPAGYR
ncbi:flagellar protein FlhE [Edwardsiella ictaluri]